MQRCLNSAFSPRLALLTFALLAIGPSLAAIADDSQYTLGPDSQRKDGVPVGKILERTWDSSVFDGTHRRFSIYVPAQYDGQEPAAVMVFQDGHAYVNPTGRFRATVVMDNLIHTKEMPVTIGIFIDPGHKRPLPEKAGWEPAPENRSFEYDSVSDLYATFLEKEILPEVAKEYKLTDDPNRRAIAGISSGGICAFTVAWHRPDMFRRVLSHVGSFVDIRGGHNYPPMIRKTEKKPIKVYLQDGSGDLDNRFGNWPLANQEMAAALKFKGYDYEFVYGSGGHNDIHGSAVLPDAMRWLWKD
jgi:enterochelin esterase family protein